MNLLKKFFGKKENPIQSYSDFWIWFQKNERSFFKVVKNFDNVEENFFNKLSDRLNELHDGFYFLTGMLDADTAELVFTADGAVKNMVFMEELVDGAPSIKGWKFTAHKPAIDLQNLNIEMAGYSFNQQNLSFHANEHSAYPDEIDITIVHPDMTDDNQPAIRNGTLIFLDNYLGELNFATSIDNLQVIGKKNAPKELIPIEKLKHYVIWREKEFIEKYEGVRHNTESESYTVLEAELENGNKMIAVINPDLLLWEAKASHPWIMQVDIAYADGGSGMPDDPTFTLLGEFEKEIMAELKDSEGYLNIGRQTAENKREIYFACRDFRKPSRVLHNLTLQYAQKLEVSFDIYKDKYWQSFNRFATV